MREDAPPTWLRVSTEGVAPHDHWLVFLPGTYSHDIRGSLALAPSDSCVAYERIDVRGQVIAQVEDCTPRKCAVLGETSWTGTEIHSCGDLPPLLDGFWGAAGDDSCSAPPRISQDPSSYEVIVTPAAANDDASQRAAT